VARTTVADRLAPLLTALLGPGLPLRLRCWDGSETGPADAAATLVLRSRRALRTLVWQPDEVGLARAYVAGDLDLEGDIYAALDAPELMAKLAGNEGLTVTTRQKLAAVATAVRLGALGPRPPLPPEEIARPRGLRRRHSRSSDAAAVSHHYDVGNDFYRVVLGPTLVYSCAYWREGATPPDGLDDAQTDKLELVCRKLALQPGMTLLDVGCGWGSLVLHAAQHHGVRAVGITLSHEQAALARKRVAEAGLTDRVEIREQDYREVTDEPYDAIASVGMAEHVGSRELPRYARLLAGLLRPRGRLLNHAIASRPSPPHAPEEQRSSFIDRYVFPDGEVTPLALTVDALEQAGLEVRDVESLREHYALTLRSWVARLDANWAEAVRLTSEGRARVWRLYMVGSVLAFQSGDIGVNQVLAVRRDPTGASGMPRRPRPGWVL